MLDYIKQNIYFLCFAFKFFILLRVYPKQIDITQIQTIYDYFMDFKM